MKSVLERLDLVKSIDELPGIKSDIEAEIQAENILYENNMLKCMEARKLYEQYKKDANENKKKLSRLELNNTVGKKYIELITL